MGKSDQIYPGERLRGFFRNILSGEPSLAVDVRERLVEAFAQRINLMRVWDYPESPLAASVDRGRADRAPAPSPSLAGQSEDYAPWPDLDQETCDALAAAGDLDDTPPFNPFAFNAIVVFKREGSAALLTKLQSISSAQHLRALAEAQHLAVPSGLETVEELQRAILKGAEQRLADRLAAGS